MKCHRPITLPYGQVNGNVLYSITKYQKEENTHFVILGGKILAENKHENVKIQSKPLFMLTIGEDLLSPPCGSERNDTTVNVFMTPEVWCSVTHLSLGSLFSSG